MEFNYLKIPASNLNVVIGRDRGEKVHGFCFLNKFIGLLSFQGLGSSNLTNFALCVINTIGPVWTCLAMLGQPIHRKFWMKPQ